MNIEELKARAESARVYEDDFAMDHFQAYCGPDAILSLIADLEQAQDERRALLATEQNLRERVKALEECVSMFLEADVYADSEGIVQIAHADTASCISAVNIARALLEKTT